MKEYIPVELRRQLAERAGDACEYCRLPNAASLYALQVDHIIPEKQGGPTVLENLALACRECNHYKGYSVVKHYYESGKTILLFNPRKELWVSHFAMLESGLIVSDTDTGRATIEVLSINETTRVEGRLLLIRNGVLTP